MVSGLLTCSHLFKDFALAERQMNVDARHISGGFTDTYIK
jgi:hypothetical protein